MKNSNVKEEVIKGDTSVSKMSTFEKIFWGTILVFLILSVVLTIMASINTKNVEMRVPILSQWSEKLLPTDRIKSNLTNNEAKVNESLNLGVLEVNHHIDNEINDLFYTVESNVDTFLDFHYSVFGEYSELITMANPNDSIEDVIEDKLFSSDFTKKLDQKSKYINNKFMQSIKNHSETITNIGMNGIDKQVNTEALNRLNKDMEFNLATQATKMTAAASAAAYHFGPQLVAALGIKIAGKATAKAAGKGALKVGAKSLGAGGAATAGALAGTWCGPLAWICSPVGAVVGAGSVWLGTDAVLVTGDEILNREDFKNEILVSLRDSKESLKSSYKKNYYEHFEKYSKDTIDKVSNTPVKERVKLKDKFQTTAFK